MNAFRMFGSLVSIMVEISDVSHVMADKHTNASALPRRDKSGGQLGSVIGCEFSAHGRHGERST